MLKEIPSFDEAIKQLQNAHINEIGFKDKHIKDLSLEMVSKDECIRELEVRIKMLEDGLSTNRKSEKGKAFFNDSLRSQIEEEKDGKNLSEILTVVFENVECIFEKLHSLPSTSIKEKTTNEQKQIRDGLVRIQFLYDILERDYQKLVNKYDHLYVSFEEFKKHHLNKTAKWNAFKAQIQGRKKSSPISKLEKEESGINSKADRKSPAKSLSHHIDTTNSYVTNDGTNAMSVTFPYINNSEIRSSLSNVDFISPGEASMTRNDLPNDENEVVLQESTVYPYTLPIFEETEYIAQISHSSMMENRKTSPNDVNMVARSLDMIEIQNPLDTNVTTEIQPQKYHSTLPKFSSDADSDATDLDICEDTQLVTADENHPSESNVNHESARIVNVPNERNQSFHQDNGSPLFLDTSMDDQHHPTQIVEHTENTNDPLQFSDEFDISSFFNSSSSQSKRRKLLSLNNRSVRSSRSETSDQSLSQHEENSNKNQIAKKKSPERINDSSTLAHKYTEVVRNKDLRKKMHGNDCSCCKKFYQVTGSLPIPDELGLPSNQTTTMEQRLNRVSRHRYVYKPPDTPADFWDVDFPSTQAIENARKSTGRKPK